MSKRFLFSFFILLSVVASSQNHYDKIRIGWDYRKQCHVGSGVYSRLKLLSNDTLTCVYSVNRGVYIRKQKDGIWSDPLLVAVDPTRQYDYTNAEMTELADGTLVYAWNARPLPKTGKPYKIMAALSNDGGLSWHNEQTLFVAGTDFEEGCWEPVVAQLPSGEVQLFFANEYEVPDKQQHIAMMRSFDNCKTWQKPEIVCFREKSRDGMPVPVILQKKKGIALAIEDNGLNGAFKPVIIYTSLKDNWQSGTVAADSPRRWGALTGRDTLAAPIYAGAPYLIQLTSGETLLSFQSGEGRKSENTLDHSLMQVYVGDNEALEFSCKSTPFPFPGNERAKTLWCALEQTGDNTVMATASVSGLEKKNGVWTSTGKIFHPMKSYRTEKFPINWDAVSEGMFIGAESQAQCRVYSVWDKDSLYFRFHVADRHVSRDPQHGTDAVELFINRDIEERQTPSLGRYRIYSSPTDKVQFQCLQKDVWKEWDASIKSYVTYWEEGYCATISIPWESIKGRPGKKGFAVFFRLHNADGNGVLIKENMSGAVQDIPQTWMRCTLSRKTMD